MFGPPSNQQLRRYDGLKLSRAEHLIGTAAFSMASRSPDTTQGGSADATTRNAACRTNGGGAERLKIGKAEKRIS